MEMVKIIVVDDHKIVRDGIKAMTLGNKNIKVIGEAANSEGLFQLLKSITPDVILLDVAIPGMSGIEIASHIFKEFPSQKILFLSAVTDENQVMDAVRAGASGFVHKDCSKPELFEAIQTIAGGEVYFCETISNIINRNYIKQLTIERTRSQVVEPVLTKREIEIIQLLAEGLTVKAIGDQLCISPRTVETHKNNILEKLSLKNTVELTRYAIKNGLVKL